MRLWRFVGTGTLAVNHSRCCSAGQPTKEDTDFCDQKAAQVSKAARRRDHASVDSSAGEQPDR